MVRFETVEVTKEIMKNMAKKPQSLRKTPKASSRNKRAAVTPESGRSSPAGSSSPSSSSSSSYSSEFSGGEDVSSQPSPRGSDSPVYCVMSTIPDIEDEPGGLSQEDCEGSGTSGAVQALTEVARGLGMDVVWLSTLHWVKTQMSSVAFHVAVMQFNCLLHFNIFRCGAVSGNTTGTAFQVGASVWSPVFVMLISVQIFGGRHWEHKLLCEDMLNIGLWIWHNSKHYEATSTHHTVLSVVSVMLLDRGFKRDIIFYGSFEMLQNFKYIFGTNRNFSFFLLAAAVLCLVLKTTFKIPLRFPQL